MRKLTEEEKDRLSELLGAETLGLTLATRKSDGAEVALIAGKWETEDGEILIVPFGELILNEDVHKYAPLEGMRQAVADFDDEGKPGFKEDE